MQARERERSLARATVCVYSALSCARVKPPGVSRVCARARLLIYFDVSLRKLRARAYPALRSLPTLSRPVPYLATTSFSGGYKSRANGGREIRETSLSKVMRPQHFAVHRVPQVEIIPSEFLRIYAAELKRSHRVKPARLTRRLLNQREFGATELTGAIFTRRAISRTEVYRATWRAYVTAKLCWKQSLSSFINTFERCQT